MPTEDEQLQAMGGSLATLHRPKGYYPKGSICNGRRYLSGLRPYIGPGKRLLDVGCGDGSFMHLASQCGLQVTGIDLDPQAAVIARDLYGLPVITGTIDALNSNSNKFDIISVAHTLEHIPDPREFLEGLSRLLKPDGILFVEVPNIMRPKASYHRLFSLQHHYYFCPETLAAMLARSGFRPTGSRCFFRDSFQVIAVPDHSVDPQLFQGIDWRKAAAVIRTHRWVYKLSLQFIWRKIPFVKNIMYAGKCRAF